MVDFEKTYSSSNDFSLMIEKLSFEKKIPYIDTVIKFCEDNDVDINDVKRYINKSLKEKIQSEAINLNYLKKTTSSLPF